MYYEDSLMGSDLVNDYWNSLSHYGIKRRSGRYPWGSGDNPFQHEEWWLNEVKRRKKSGESEKSIADSEGLSVAQLRAYIDIATNEVKLAKRAKAIELSEEGKGPTEIGKIMGVPEGTVRGWLSSDNIKNNEITYKTAELLMDNVDEKGYIDVGAGVEYDASEILGQSVSNQRLNNAIEIAKANGYPMWNVKVKQQGTGKPTTIKVLCPPETTLGMAIQNQNNIRALGNYVTDGDVTKVGPVYPQSISSSRVLCTYKENGGAEKDGLIEIRRGVKDLDLNGVNYAQVRIAVDNKKYLKGVAVYSDNIPDGYDIVFNTSKPMAKGKLGVMKDFKTKEVKDEDGNVTEVVDEDNVFGAAIKEKGGQYSYIGDDGKKHLSAINKVNEEGDWETWSKTLASQFLSKQSKSLAKKQLDLNYSFSESEFEDIMAIDQPELKQYLLNAFADECDSAAVDLKAAGLPRQTSALILPVPQLKPNEIYAPRYENGEKVVLIRYPHAGKFEIAELTVNNKNRAARAMIGTGAGDAVGINPEAATKLSGADFDGDTVTVIPANYGNNVKISVEEQQHEMKEFTDKFHDMYATDGTQPKMTNAEKQREMGNVTNLITDMTMQGAPPEEVIRAVKHSMVIIDAQKHQLDWKRSFKENGIAELKKKYQGAENAGASTIISRSSAEKDVDELSDTIDRDILKATGDKRYKPTGRTYRIYEVKETVINPNTGRPNTKWVKIRAKDLTNYNPDDIRVREEKYKTKTTKMGDAYDAYELVSQKMYPIEIVYADYANKQKNLARKARLEALKIESSKRSPEAAEKYAAELISLDNKLDIAKRNAPKERQAQVIAGSIVKRILEENPEYYDDKDKLKKVKAQAISVGRARTGAGKTRVVFTEREWEALMAGAISSTKIRTLLSNADMDEVKKMANPRADIEVPKSKQSAIKAMVARGYTLEEVADRYGVSVSTVEKYK